eukprot:COSAG06_NODE_30575_length_536_cov_1.235698_2_plen_99_part_01
MLAFTLAEVQSPAPDQLSQLMRQTNSSYEYNSISGFYATIQNSYATINFQLGLKRVLSFWASFITSSHINNFGLHLARVVVHLVLGVDEVVGDELRLGV